MRGGGTDPRYNPRVIREPRTVAFQGEKGAFSQVAVGQLLGDKVKVVPCQRFEEVFRSLRDKKVEAAVIPIENTLHGSVHENYDHLLNFDLPIVGETTCGWPIP
jgi:Prephenate dehydratase